MPSYADLHLHTSYSDGSDPPEQVVDRASECGFAAIAITDHDTLAGLDEAQRAASLRSIELITGVEISARFGQVEVHVVGLGIDKNCKKLLNALQEQVQSRSDRVDKIVERLNALNVPVSREDVEAQAQGGCSIGRMHVAQALMAKGITKQVQEGFDRFLKRGKKAYIPKKTLSCAEAIDLIHVSGGVAILAHPGVGSTVENMLTQLFTLPFDGLEVYHSKHTPGHVTQFVQFAMANDLLISGGSDCHGTATNAQPDMGKVRLPYQHVDVIKDVLKRGRRRR